MQGFKKIFKKEVREKSKANGITFIAGFFCLFVCLLNGTFWPANLFAFQNIYSGNTLGLSGPQKTV